MSKLMPNTVTRYTRVLAWLTAIVQIGIVGTGGLVRVTGSGLGCPTWPYCTDESLVATPEMGIHGVIEFGNRTLTGLLAAVAVLTILALWNTRGSALRLLGPAVWIGALTLVQAIVGGITVLVELDPRIVGVHFVFSAVLASLAGLLLFRVRRAEPVPEVRANVLLRVAGYSTLALTWLTVLVGVLTTGSGPHAGDTIAARNGLDPVVMQHVHSWPAYALLAATLFLLIVAMQQRQPRVRTGSLVLLGLLGVQTAIGIVQSRLGLPEGLVVAHMLLSVTSLAYATAVMAEILRSRDPRKTSPISEPEPSVAHAQ